MALENKFKAEEITRDKILDDLDNEENFRICYLVTDETIGKYDGSQIVPLFHDDNVADGHDLKSDPSLHHKLLVNESIRTNEFISML